MKITEDILSGLARDVSGEGEDLAEHLAEAHGVLSEELKGRFAARLSVIYRRLTRMAEELAAEVDPYLLTIHSEGRARGRKVSKRPRGGWQ
jgi:hypothetical protein